MRVKPPRAVKKLNTLNNLPFLSLGFVTPFPSSNPDTYDGRKVIVKVPISFALNSGDYSSRLTQGPPMRRPRSLNRYERVWYRDINCADAVVN